MEKSYQTLNTINTVGDLKKYLSILDDNTPIEGKFYKFGKENDEEKIEGCKFTFIIFKEEKKNK